MPVNVHTTIQSSDAKPCPKCQAPTFVPALPYRDGDRKPAIERTVWFCFECGYEDA